MITRVSFVRRGAAIFGVLGVLSAASMVSAQSLPDNTQATATPLGAEALALRGALERVLGPKSPAIAAYAERGFAPIWMEAGGTVGDRARTLVKTLSDAGRHALPAAKYRGAVLTTRLDGPIADPAGLEAELSRAYLDYARDVTSGILEPKSVDRELHVFPARPDPAALIAAAHGAGDMLAHLEGLAPNDPLYGRLKERYATFRSVAAGDIWGLPVPGGRTLRPGDRNARIASARARLTAMGDLDPNIYGEQAASVSTDGTQIATAEVTTDVPVQTFDADHFDQPMADALKRFQERHGLNLDGVIGPATLKQLNVSPRERAEQIAVNLERLRWMNRDLGERHVLVNLAGFTMAVMRGGAADFTSRVVVGKARKHRTPEFSDVMSHMIVNPSWHVPRSIATKEILPKLQADPGYLSRKGMRLVGADESTVDWSTVTPGSFPGRITQRPGRGNALGTVKFMFPNQFAIYLHDTPSKRLFNRDVRAYSHGCVRVEKPHEFAEYLLSSQREDAGDFFRSVLKRGRERRINLDQELPVHLTYRTAWIDENGIEQFRGDVYRRDRKVAAALSETGVVVLQ